MAQNDSAHYLIAYDIRDPRRLGRVFRYLKKEATPIQYSLWLYSGRATQLGAVMTQIGRRINPNADDVRAYRIPAKPWAYAMGASLLPEGLLPDSPAEAMHNVRRGKA
ncbi:MAG: hypothetical protein OHK0048_21710 [Rhodoferax sp.]